MSNTHIIGLDLHKKFKWFIGLLDIQCQFLVIVYHCAILLKNETKLRKRENKKKIDNPSKE